MDCHDNNTKQYKYKHLSFKERAKIELLIQQGHSAYAIAKILGRASNTIRNEIKRGTVEQIKQYNKKIMTYFADTGQLRYENNRKACCPKFKRYICKDFIDYVVKVVKSGEQSIDACIGQAKLKGFFSRNQMVSTKTMYNYVDLNLLKLRNIDLPLKLSRSTKPKRVRKHKIALGRSIEERPLHIQLREEFGHWEIDTIIGKKTKDDNVLLTIIERKTRMYLILKIPGKDANSVNEAIEVLKEMFGSMFSKVFKTITSDNGREFAQLSELENSTKTSIYFAHPYASYERGSNECHNGLVRRFIPKGTSIKDQTLDFIEFIEDWCNDLPRKILNYRTPSELFEEELDKIYAL